MAIYRAKNTDHVSLYDESQAMMFIFLLNMIYRISSQSF